jgi:hypothetical protein
MREEGTSEEDERRTRRELIRKYAPQMEGSPRQVVSELGEAKVLRAVWSERQLDEVLVDFWLNHFNVYAPKGPVKFFVAEYERDALRKHAWGRFESLLLATAESPAMLFYLDNWLSQGPDAPARGEGAGRLRAHGRGRGPGSPPKQGQAKKSHGLNENYAREIMELHTLGVDGGYTQKDVTEVARCFTGWTIRGLRQGEPAFAFEPRVHDRGDKVVLGSRRGGMAKISPWTALRSGIRCRRKAMSSTRGRMGRPGGRPFHVLLVCEGHITARFSPVERLFPDVARAIAGHQVLQTVATRRPAQLTYATRQVEGFYRRASVGSNYRDFP